MDRVGLRELLRNAVVSAEKAWMAETRQGDEQILDSSTVFDRVTQMAMIALDHHEDWLWSEAVGSLLAIFRVGLPENRDAWPPSATEGLWMARVAQRVLLLGALCRRLGRYEQVRELVLQRPVERYQDTLWLRYAVTMASRGEVDEVFKGKSLIGPASEAIRRKPQFFLRFDENLDEVVNRMCQFDYLSCIISVADTRSPDSFYPNFGGYFRHRTLPVVHELVDGGAARVAIPDVDDRELAEIMAFVGKQARKAFFEIAGWEGYDQMALSFIQRHQDSER